MSGKKNAANWHKYGCDICGFKDIHEIVFAVCSVRKEMHLTHLFGERQKILNFVSRQFDSYWRKKECARPKIYGELLCQEVFLFIQN